MHYLLPEASRNFVSLLRLRVILEAYEGGHFRSEYIAVKFDRFLAAAVKEQVGLDKASLFRRSHSVLVRFISTTNYETISGHNFVQSAS
jgi:hypothetical protein